jgi:hypothetical protein
VHRHRILLVFAALLVAACDDPFGPEFWSDRPDTTQLYSAARPELAGLPSAFDFVELVRYRIESPAATGSWDLALSEKDGGFVMIPAGSFEGIESRAGIAVTSATDLADVLEAPRDTAAFVRQPVPLTLGTVYVVRTRRASCGFTAGVRYAKFRAIEMDLAAGTMRFEFVRNPYCDNRSFVPPES